MLNGPGGESEFARQEIETAPKTRTLVLFPPFCTHIRRAVAAEHDTWKKPQMRCGP